MVNKVTKTASERFWSKVRKNIVTGCWEWQGAIGSHGYGNFAKSGIRSNPEYERAHRYSYESIKGPVPDGLHLDHLCRNRKCVNPDHLEPVTPGENLRRGHHPNMIARKEKTCTKGHKVEGDNVVTERRSNGSIRHRCRICAQDREKKRAKRRYSSSSI